MALSHKVIRYIEKLRYKGLLRQRELRPSTCRTMVYFDSNDYLSLINDSRVLAAYQMAYKKLPNGSGASMVLSGYHPQHQLLERTFAELLGVEDCLLFSSGYAANLAISSLLGKIDADCIIDKNCHASIYDGLSLAGLRYQRYRHNDMDHLGRLLTEATGDVAVITEGIFSMSGQQAPLRKLKELSSITNFDLIVDEAHSFGVIGRQGRGATDHHQLGQADVPLRIIPLGKACAAQGAIVAGNKQWIEALLQAGRSFIYSTALSPALCYGIIKTLEIVIASDNRRVKLSQLIAFFNEIRRSSPLNWVESDTCIQQLRLGCPKKALFYADQLKKQGIHCSAIRVPTVNHLSSGLRVIINYNHTEEQINTLFNTLHSIYDNTSI